MKFKLEQNLNLQSLEQALILWMAQGQNDKSWSPAKTAQS